MPQPDVNVAMAQPQVQVQQQANVQVQRAEGQPQVRIERMGEGQPTAAAPQQQQQAAVSSPQATGALPGGQTLACRALPTWPCTTRAAMSPGMSSGSSRGRMGSSRAPRPCLPGCWPRTASKSRSATYRRTARRSGHAPPPASSATRQASRSGVWAARRNKTALPGTRCRTRWMRRVDSSIAGNLDRYRSL